MKTGRESRVESRGLERDETATVSSGARRSTLDARPGQGAFSLLEVMIAMGIFFMATFAILALVSSTLRNARGLQQANVDAGMLAAQLSLTNRLDEGGDSGDFGDLYPGYTWSREVYEVGSNGLFQADFTVSRRVGHQQAESHMGVLLFRPESPPGQASKLSGGFK